MAGDAGGAFPLGSGQGDVGRVDRSHSGRGGAGGNGDGERPLEAGKAVGRCGKPLQLPTGPGIRDGLPARDCPQPEISGAERKSRDGACSPSQRSCRRSGGGGSPGLGTPVPAGVGSTRRERIQAVGVGSSPAPRSRQGLAGGESSADGGGLGGRRSDEKPGRGASGQGGAVHRGRIRCGALDDAGKKWRGPRCTGRRS